MEKIIGFKNVHALVNDEIVVTNILVEDGKIKEVGGNEVPGMISLDENKIVIPGFIDEHIHGAGGSDAMDANYDDLHNIACTIAKEGTTAFLATTMTQSPEKINAALKNVNAYINKEVEDGAKVLGVHLEGPYISLKHVGAQPIEYVQKPSVDSFKSYNESAGGHIMEVSLAPEVEGSKELVEYLHANKIVASIGHTDATFKDCENAVANGATCVTHTYNAQKGLHHREAGTVGAAFMLDELNAELICDGIHVSSPAINILYKNKPLNKFTLITDAMRAKGMPDGESELGGQLVIVKNGEARLADGTLAGSVLLMNNAVRNLMNFTKISFVDAVRCATINPAMNLGVADHMGFIKAGYDANFVVVDKDLTVFNTIRDGKVVYTK